jgi:hypothetical protein
MVSVWPIKLVLRHVLRHEVYEVSVTSIKFTRLGKISLRHKKTLPQIFLWQGLILFEFARVGKNQLRKEYT